LQQLPVQRPWVSLAEGRTDQLVPHVRQSATLVMSIYSGYLTVGTLAYWLAGMNLLMPLIIPLQHYRQVAFPPTLKALLIGILSLSKQCRLF